MPRINSEKIRSKIYHALVQFHSDIELKSLFYLYTFFLYRLPFDNIWEPDKPIGVAYIDDKGIKFKNNWGEITERLVTKSKKN